MGKWINKNIETTAAAESGDHIAIEDLARMADGAVDKAERQLFVRHLNDLFVLFGSLYKGNGVGLFLIFFLG